MNLSLTDDSSAWAKEFVKEHKVPENTARSWFAHAIEVGKNFGSKASHRNVTSSKFDALMDSGLFYLCEFHSCHYWCNRSNGDKVCMRLKY